MTWGRNMTDEEFALANLQRKITDASIRAKLNGYVHVDLHLTGREIHLLRRVVTTITLDDTRNGPERAIPTWPWWMIVPLAGLLLTGLDSVTGRPVEALWRWMMS